MSNHYFAINHGKDGFKGTDFTLGTSSSAASDIELRVADLDGQSKPLKRRDVIVALKAFERMFESGKTFITFLPL
jgi:hypothetical protein